MEEMKMITVFLDGKQLEVPEGTTLLQIAAREYDPCHKFPALLARENKKLIELFRPVRANGSYRFIDITDPIGHRTYKRSMNMLFVKALYAVTKGMDLEKVVLRFAVGDGFFYTVQGDVKITEKLLEDIRAYMNLLVQSHTPFEKKTISTWEAKEIFHNSKMYDKERLFRYRRPSQVNVYELGSYVDYCYGYMVPDTGYLSLYQLIPHADGIILWMPSLEQPDTLRPFSHSEKVFAVQREAEDWADHLNVDTVGDLNDRICEGVMTPVQMISEALQEGKISEIAAEIAKRGQVKFVMIAGPSSSGKTTFSRRLSVQLQAQGLTPHPISVDNYFKRREDTPKDENGEYDYECLGAMDVELFNSDMTKLLKGETVELPVYNFITGEREYKGDYMTMGPSDVLVIEGIHCLNDAFSHTLPKENKYKIYISALTQLNIDEHNRIPTTDGRLIRRIVRDNRTRGTKARETIARWPSVRRGEEGNIFPYQEEADVVFNSALIYELSILKLYAEPLLFQVTREDKEFDEANRLLKFLDYFLPMPSEGVPNNSILREFIGGSCFDV